VHIYPGYTHLVGILKKSRSNVKSADQECDDEESKDSPFKAEDVPMKEEKLSELSESEAEDDDD